MLTLKDIKSIRVSSQGQPYGHVTLQSHRSPCSEGCVLGFVFCSLNKGPHIFISPGVLQDYIELVLELLSMVNHYCLKGKRTFQNHLGVL